MNNLIKSAVIASVALAAANASAGVISSFGTGSAVSNVTNSANFELNSGMLSGYTEGGMVFSYTGSSYNNGCGYAGCSYHAGFFPGFSGNYMYSVGSNAYISIKMADNSDFSAIEFAAGSGFGNINGFWQTYNNAILTGAGAFTTSGVQVLGLYDASGFDEVRYASFQMANATSGYSAGAIDSVRVGGHSVSNVSEPSALFLLGLGLLGLAGARARK